MDFNELNHQDDEKIEQLTEEEQEGETTKELQTLKDLSAQALNSIENEYQEDFDEGLNDADLIFKTVVDTKEEMTKEQESKKEEEETEKEKNIFKKIAAFWQKSDKKKKIAIICGGIVLLILLGVGLFFLLRKNPEPALPDEPDVIIEMNNYRYENGSLVFLDGDTELGRYECENKNENQCAVAYLSSEETLSGTKKEDQDGNPLKLQAPIYLKRYAFITDHANDIDQSIRIYDLQENQTIKTVFAVKAYDEYENYVVLKNEESMYGLEVFTESGLVTVVPYNYDALSLLPNQSELNLLTVTKDNNSYLTDIQNRILTKAFTSPIVSGNATHVVTKDASNKYHVYNYDAVELNPGNYDYIALLDNYMIAVENASLYVTDYEGNKMHSEGYALKNSSYDPVETYEDYRLTKTTKAFDYSLTDNILNINIYDGEDYENKSINLLEGNFSKNLAFMSYFNGHLYFYEDEAKENLLGSYACTNRNEITAETTELSNCKLATDSFYRETTGNTKEVDEQSNLGAIPLINREFIFIADGEEINLYDLTNNKKLANYEHVDTSSYTNTSSLNFVNTNNVYFIAQSKNSGKFGVANITLEGVVPIIPFEYNSIKRLGDYYVVENDEGFTLYDLTGKDVSATKVGRIVDYLIVDDNHRYLKTYANDTYFVHTFTDEVSSTAYNYIELYDGYYAAVLNKKVHVFDYENNEITITEEGESGLALNIDNYYGSGTKAFRVTFDEDYVYVEIGNSNNTYTKAVGFPKEKQTTDDNDKPAEEGDEGRDNES